MNMNRISAPIRACVRRHVRQAFTLIELMISIALAALIMAGIHFIFSTTSRTAGMAHGLVSVVANARAAEPVMRQDLHGAAMDGPFFMIRSGRTFAFLNRDEEIAAGGNPAMKRPYRTDMLMFFARGRFPRQTGNDGQYVAPMSSDEAYIWYGHLLQPLPDYQQPDDSWAHSGPGVGSGATNPRNYYARDWILGRVAMLLREPDNMLDDFDQPQSYVRRGGVTPAPPEHLSPLSFNSMANDASGSRIEKSRYDLAGTSIAGYRTILNTAIPLLIAQGEDWWSGPSATSRFGYRFQGNPHLLKPLNSFRMARTAPCFLLGCVSFAVEFAGDFLTQDADGIIIANVPDGHIDFIREDLDPPNGLWANRVRWYGLPRDVDGDGAIDVQPLANSTVPVVNFSGFPFERFITADRYIVAWGPDSATYVPGPSFEPLPTPRPAMVRVVLSVDDPDGRLADSQSYEYVFALP